MNTKDFKQKLHEQKTVIDAALKVHSDALQHDTKVRYTGASVKVVDAYVQVLGRGGKRIRGALTMLGYEMCGGVNVAMITEAACAIEMTHAYILVLDDIMDKSVMRRGGPSAHMLLSDYHANQGLLGDGYHFGEAAAINAALIGCHYAQKIVTQLDAEANNKLKALALLNEALVVTGHGQINDIYNEVTSHVDAQAVDQVLEWKTAHYTFLNPLQFGMALAGASDEEIASVYDYCMHAGRAFQITDDILGTFGNEQDAGKSPMDDIREGKRTVLSVVALERASSTDKNFLMHMLGNENLTQVEFLRCKEIFTDSGALVVAKEQAENHVRLAQESLKSSKNTISAEGIEYLQELVMSLLGRHQ